ncbi:hypothetical protein [Palleronia caenipelagi]|uniref:Uncharacterized protein n=1 Tax=Palleronia caenipelagi TaxID=2489174 RepID=A0A547PW66_9RHOB|nr:hypothetical protein [Palleronia caenipelagi]TRD18356.1 hypothetical protein FEV53_11920 [Palleronia caenipelagi]
MTALRLPYQISNPLSGSADILDRIRSTFGADLDGIYAPSGALASQDGTRLKPLIRKVDAYGNSAPLIATGGTFFPTHYDLPTLGDVLTINQPMANLTDYSVGLLIHCSEAFLRPLDEDGNIDEDAQYTSSVINPPAISLYKRKGVHYMTFFSATPFFYEDTLTLTERTRLRITEGGWYTLQATRRADGTATLKINDRDPVSFFIGDAPLSSDPITINAANGRFAALLLTAGGLADTPARAALWEEYCQHARDFLPDG